MKFCQLAARFLTNEVSRDEACQHEIEAPPRGIFKMADRRLSVETKHSRND